MPSNSSARLVFVDDSLPGITRRRAGKGWRYFDAAGLPLTDREEVDRLNAVALPPAYRDAWFCPASNGHILATGYDDKGRKQYRYHPDFRAAREAEKFDGCVAFGKLLPLVRQRVEADLALSALSLERAVASVVRLLDTGGIRVGNEAYAKANRAGTAMSPASTMKLVTTWSALNLLGPAYSWRTEVYATAPVVGGAGVPGRVGVIVQDAFLSALNTSLTIASVVALGGAVLAWFLIADAPSRAAVDGHRTHTADLLDAAEEAGTPEAEAVLAGGPTRV